MNKKGLKNTACNYRIKKAFGIATLALGIAILCVFIIFALFPQQIAPYAPTQSFDKLLGCDGDHILGTNNIGFDIFSQLVYATRSTLLIGLASALICLVVGITVGMLAGYLSGIAGEAVNGIISFFLLIPMLPMAIVLSAYIGGGHLSIILAISMLCWCSTARAVRAKTMEVRASSFIKSLKSLGYSELRIMFRHILPNILDVAFARFIPSIASCIMLEATLSFLGMGDLTQITWGVMINYAYSYGGLSLGLYNWLLPPGIAIALIQASFYMISHYFDFRRQIVREIFNSTKNLI